MIAWIMMFIKKSFKFFKVLVKKYKMDFLLGKKIWPNKFINSRKIYLNI